MADHTTPPDAITWYHAPWLKSAEAGTLRYDLTRYPIHGVNPNTVRCIWCGLLADGDTGPAITPLGQRLLDEYRAATAEEPPAPAPAAPTAARPVAPPAAWSQPVLFATA